MRYLVLQDTKYINLGTQPQDIFQYPEKKYLRIILLGFPSWQTSWQRGFNFEYIAGPPVL